MTHLPTGFGEEVEVGGENDFAWAIPVSKWKKKTKVIKALQIEVQYRYIEFRASWVMVTHCVGCTERHSSH